MLLDYHLLSHIRVNHLFFSNGLAAVTELVTSRDTLKKARSLGLIIKQSPGDLKILGSVNTEDKIKTIDPALQSNFTLTFYLRITDKHWTNYTNLEKKQNQTLFFSNLNNKKVDDIYALHSTEFASDNDLIDTLHLSPVSINDFELKSPQLVKIGGAFEDCNYAIIPGNETTFLDPKNLDEGLYELKDGDTLVKRYFVQKEPGIFYGICHLVFGDTQGIDQPFADPNGAVTPYTALINFSALSTYWRYFIPAEQLKQFNGIQIKSVKESNGNGNGTAEDTAESIENGFTDPKTVKAPNGQEMLCFTSKEEIELREKPTGKLQLRKNVGVENRSEGIIINHLPLPKKESLYRLNENGDRFSDIYIYI